MITSEAARFKPFAPVGGTMCAASPARNRRPNRSGAATKLCSGAVLLSLAGPVVTRSATIRQSGPQLVPERRVGPVLDLRVEPTLHVVAAARAASLAAHAAAAPLVAA